ncbi:MAG: HEAT repeat domain-containing protein [Deltaproteobacteria bacterium]|nr:HEAT repeat domain-containing protein [Deltaproteobacteria bacterium]
MNAGSFREMILSCLEAESFETVMAQASHWPPRQAVSPLIAALFREAPRVRWHAVSALGVVVAALAVTDREAARVVVRRLMWSLNDESGSIGWGAPEALAEIIAADDGLAEEYGPLLVAYLRPGGSYLELPAIQRGLMWAMSRLAETRPGLLRGLNVPAQLIPYLDSKDPEIRGLAVRALGFLGDHGVAKRLSALKGDPAEFLFYDRGTLANVTVGALAGVALKHMADPGGCPDRRP